MISPHICIVIQYTHLTNRHRAKIIAASESRCPRSPGNDSCLISQHLSYLLSRCYLVSVIYLIRSSPPTPIPTPFPTPLLHTFCTPLLHTTYPHHFPHHLHTTSPHIHFFTSLVHTTSHSTYPHLHFSTPPLHITRTMKTVCS